MRYQFLHYNCFWTIYILIIWSCGQNLRTIMKKIDLMNICLNLMKKPNGITQHHAKYQCSWSNRSWGKWWFNQMLQENEALLDTWPNAFYFILWTEPYPKMLSSLTQVPARFDSNQVCYVVIAFAEIAVLVNQSRREARHWFNFKSFAFRLSFYI